MLPLAWLCHCFVSCIWLLPRATRRSTGVSQGLCALSWKSPSPAHGCLETSQPASMRFVIERKRNEGPSNGDSQHHHHRHQDSSRFAHDHIAIGQRAPTVSRALPPVAPMRFKVGQRAASRLGADLHAELLEKAGDLVSTSAKGSCRNPPTPFPDNLGSNVPAHPRAVFITDIQPAEPETWHPSLPHLVYLDLLYMP